MVIENKLRMDSFLTFKIREEEFGVKVDKVKKILELKEITQIPLAPDYMKGVINMQGMVIPIFDTRIKLGIPPTKFTNNTCIVVMDLKGKNEISHIGALVDSVCNVHEIKEQNIESISRMDNIHNFEFIQGVARQNNKFIMILDVIKLFDYKHSSHN